MSTESVSEDFRDNGRQIGVSSIAPAHVNMAGSTPVAVRQDFGAAANYGSTPSLQIAPVLNSDDKIQLRDSATAVGQTLSDKGGVEGMKMSSNDSDMGFAAKSMAKIGMEATQAFMSIFRDKSQDGPEQLPEAEPGQPAPVQQVSVTPPRPILGL